MNLRSWRPDGFSPLANRVCQEKKAGLSARLASIALFIETIGWSNWSNVPFLLCTPFEMNSNPSNTPRSEGSVPMIESTGRALIRPPTVFWTSSGAMKSRPFLAKKGPPSGITTSLKTSGWFRSLA